MMRAPYESATAPTSHSAADPAEFNVVCRSKSNLPNRTDSNAALLPYLNGAAFETGLTQLAVTESQRGKECTVLRVLETHTANKESKKNGAKSSKKNPRGYLLTSLVS